MRQVRRKIADPSVRKYLLKAKEEGIKLSWNRYEKMLPQDGFGSLGLTCFDCLQGPCRLNPFSRVEERTICGLTREDLVYKGLYRFISNSQYKLGTDDMARVTEENTGLIGLARCQIEKMKKISDSRQVQGTTKQIGLGVLQQEYVNICLEEVSPTLMHVIQDLALELENEAIRCGAKGFNIVIAGDIAPNFPFDSVSNTGGVELAVLTGLLDYYVVGSGGLGVGKNVVPYYHTEYAEADDEASQVKVKDWLVKATAAYTRRDNKKVLPSDEIGEVEIITLDHKQIKNALKKGEIQGICILGGGSNLKVTQDALVCDAAKSMAGEDILCLTYGNTGVTLGKYGYHAHCVGAEIDAVKILSLVESIGSEKVIALFPELTTARDFIVSLVLAGAGVKVLTAINLPLEGSKEVAGKIDELITYCPPSEYVNEASNFFKR